MKEGFMRSSFYFKTISRILIFTMFDLGWQVHRMQFSAVPHTLLSAFSGRI